MLTDIGNPEACFISGIKAVFMENRGCNDLWRAAEGGHDAAAYLYAILLYRDNGSAATDDTVKLYMRRIAGGGSTKSRWLSNEECLPLHENAAVRSTRLGTFGVNHCRLRHRCAVISRAQEMAVAAVWINDGLEFLCFVAKTIGSTAKW
jgi:hypothetical protein